MKKIIYLLAIASIFSACKDALPENLDDDIISVGLSLSGEISITDEPLTKTGESNALIGIQVYQAGSPYAWGLFDTTDGISICLHSGSEYSIICQYIKNGKEVLHYFSKTNDATVNTYKLSDAFSGYYREKSDGPSITIATGGPYNYHRSSNGYGAPFCIDDHYNPGCECWCTSYISNKGHYYPGSGSELNTSYSICSITNHFTYSNSDIILAASSTVSIDQTASETIDRYYGESGSFIAASESGKTINLDMKHLVYGIQCNVTGISDGTATITIKNGDTTLLSQSNISGEYHSGDLVFAFSDMHGAWQYADNYTENVTVSMTWMRGVGILQDLGSQVVQVKRNCNNIISVSLSTPM